MNTRYIFINVWQRNALISDKFSNIDYSRSPHSKHINMKIKDCTLVGLV